MEEHLNPLAVTHLLQYTLRSLCCQDNSQWVYAVFWRILPRNYPPPKWDNHGGAYDRSRGNRRNWILVWEDGFCNFAASSSTSSTAEINSGDYPSSSASSSANYGNSDQFPLFQGLQPELFFKMSHEIYNYGEGLIGKVAADHSHKWIHKEPNENQEINFLSAWHNSADAQPRTWEAQFHSGIKTIALIAVREGVVQLGSMQKVVEDLSYIVSLRKKFSYIESIPGVLLPHPSSAAFPAVACRPIVDAYIGPDMWAYQGGGGAIGPTCMGPMDQYGFAQHHLISHQVAQHQDQPMVRMITPSMSSLEALLSKLPSVGPGPTQHGPGIGGLCGPEAHHYNNNNNNNNNNQSNKEVLELMGQRGAKDDEEADEEEQQHHFIPFNHHHNHNHNHNHNQDLNIAASCRPGTGF